MGSVDGLSLERPFSVMDSGSVSREDNANTPCTSEVNRENICSTSSDVDSN